MSKHIMTYRFGGEGQDQRLCHREDGVYVFDWSGDSPETTDDGPLLVPPNSTCELHVFGGSLQVRVPVHRLRTDELLHCSMGLECFETLTKLLPGIKLARTTQYRRLARVILKAEALAIELEGKQ